VTREVLAAARVLGAGDATWVAIEDGAVAEVGRGDVASEATDLGGAILSPGFVDIQINGIGSVDFSRTDRIGYTTAEELLLAHGVTTFVPTLISAPLESLAPAMQVLMDAGAIGVHLEGPFLGGAPGAHDPSLLVPASLDWVSAMLTRFPGFIRVVTLAPEADDDAVVTRTLHRAGVVVSLGHTTCSYDEAEMFASAGARAVTHLFNGMKPLHHREPGLVGAALDDDRLTPSLIADLVHVHPAALRLAIARKRNVVLVSDAIAIDAPWARSRGVRKIDGAPRLEDGTLAGSVLTLDRAVQNCVRIGVDVERAVEMASIIPSELLGLADRGTIAPGKRADLVALDPDDLSVRAVWKDGAIAYGAR
jgi:N-acetylglucosamine-6-phosphate deacetylase